MSTTPPTTSRAGSPGWSKFPNAVVDDVLASMNGSTVKVYLALLRHADRRGIAWPSLSRLATLCGITDRTALTAVNELHSLGLILRLSSGCTGRSNQYQIRSSIAVKTEQIAAAETPVEPQKPISDPVGNPLPTTPETHFQPTRLKEPDPMNQSFSLRDTRSRTERTFTGNIDPMFLAPAARTFGGYRPEPPAAKEARERACRQRRTQNQQDRAEASRSSQQIVDKLSRIPAEDLARLTAMALAKLPAAVAETLAGKDPLKSPMLGALLVGEMMAAVTL